jgi:hypothetical protein
VWLFSGMPEYMNVRWLPDIQGKPEHVMETGMMYAAQLRHTFCAMQKVVPSRFIFI